MEHRKITKRLLKPAYPNLHKKNRKSGIPPRCKKRDIPPAEKILFVRKISLPAAGKSLSQLRDSSCRKLAGTNEGIDSAMESMPHGVLNGQKDLVSLIT